MNQKRKQINTDNIALPEFLNLQFDYTSFTTTITFRVKEDEAKYLSARLKDSKLFQILYLKTGIYAQIKRYHKYGDTAILRAVKQAYEDKDRLKIWMRYAKMETIRSEIETIESNMFGF